MPVADRRDEARCAHLEEGNCCRLSPIEIVIDNVEFHKALGASFAQVNGVEMVAHYGAPLDEHDYLVKSAAVLDLSYRGRLCVGGNDRARFLHGQVTNDVKRLKTGEGCYAALVTA